MSKQTIFLETPVFIFSSLRIFGCFFDVIINNPCIRLCLCFHYWDYLTNNWRTRKPWLITFSSMIFQGNKWRWKSIWFPFLGRIWNHQIQDEIWNKRIFSQKRTRNILPIRRSGFWNQGFYGSLPYSTTFEPLWLHYIQRKLDNKPQCPWA